MLGDTASDIQRREETEQREREEAEKQQRGRDPGGRNFTGDGGDSSFNELSINEHRGWKRAQSNIYLLPIQAQERTGKHLFNTQ